MEFVYRGYFPKDDVSKENDIPKEDSIIEENSIKEDSFIKENLVKEDSFIKENPIKEDSFIKENPIKENNIPKENDGRTFILGNRKIKKITITNENGETIMEDSGNIIMAISIMSMEEVKKIIYDNYKLYKPIYLGILLIILTKLFSEILGGLSFLLYIIASVMLANGIGNKISGSKLIFIILISYSVAENILGCTFLGLPIGILMYYYLSNELIDTASMIGAFLLILNYEGFIKTV